MQRFSPLAASDIRALIRYSTNAETCTANAMIPKSFVQELLGRADIVDVVESYVPLKRAGTNLVACCPFHSEKTPSFTVSPSKQFYHCFGCGAHGSAIGFLMEYSGMGYVEAVKDLAARVGMQVPEIARTSGRGGRRRRTERRAARPMCCSAPRSSTKPS